jgi:hypothetical protein
MNQETEEAVEEIFLPVADFRFQGLYIFGTSVGGTWPPDSEPYNRLQPQLQPVRQWPLQLQPIQQGSCQLILQDISMGLLSDQGQVPSSRRRRWCRQAKLLIELWRASPPTQSVSPPSDRNTYCQLSAVFSCFYISSQPVECRLFLFLKIV